MKKLLSSAVVVLFTITICAAQAPVTPPGPLCSNQTLNGDYGFTITGFRVPAPGVYVPMEGTALTHFDGNGGLTQIDNVNTGAGPLPTDRLGEGSYQLNADCSGTMTIQPKDHPEQAIQLHIVVVNEGKEIRTGVVSPGIVVTSNGRKM